MLKIDSPADDEDDVAAVRILRDDEVRAQFGTGQPTAADFERVMDDGGKTPRWQGRATALYENGQPSNLAFWGVSGD